MFQADSLVDELILLVVHMVNGFGSPILSQSIIVRRAEIVIQQSRNSRIDIYILKLLLQDMITDKLEVTPVVTLSILTFGRYQIHCSFQ
jgi:hypothetical protein